MSGVTNTQNKKNHFNQTKNTGFTNTHFPESVNDTMCDTLSHNSQHTLDSIDVFTAGRRGCGRIYDATGGVKP